MNNTDNRTDEEILQKKTSFILHYDMIDIIDELDDNEAGILIKAILSYNRDGLLPELEKTMNLIFRPFKKQFDRDIIKYISTSRKRSSAGKTTKNS